MYTHEQKTVGTMAVIRRKEDDDMKTGKCFQKQIQSDHVVLFTTIDLQPMASIRTPRINKENTIKRFKIA